MGRTAIPHPESRSALERQGNTTEKSDGTNVWAYSWDEDNRLVSASLNDVIQVSYTYDRAGRMLTRTEYEEGEVSTSSAFVWLGATLVQETSDNGIQTRFYSPKRLIYSFKRGALDYYVHTDALGNTRLITDSSGTPVSRFEYSCWGDILPTSFDGLSGGFPYRFVGALGCREDEVTGLVYMRQRWYDPSLGRFVSRDPLGNWVGFNLYTYGKNDPVTWCDPSGTDVGDDSPGADDPGGVDILSSGLEAAQAASKLIGRISKYANLPGLKYDTTAGGRRLNDKTDQPGANPFGRDVLQSLNKPNNKIRLRYNVVNQKPDCEMGLWHPDIQDLDDDDFNRLASEAPPSIVGGLLYHEFYEGKVTQELGISSRPEAHKLAIAAENNYLALNGWQRGPEVGNAIIYHNLQDNEDWALFHQESRSGIAFKWVNISKRQNLGKCEC